MRKFLEGKVEGRRAHGCKLSDEEEREAMERDRVAGLGEGGGGGGVR